MNYLHLSSLSGLLLLAAATCPAESLWTDQGSAARMFSDRKAVDVGDIVTVVIQETASISSSSETSTDKSSSTNDQLGKLLYSTSDFLKRDGELPGLDWSSSSTFSGGGSISGQRSASTQLSAMVTDKQPNGNLIIEGVRRTILNNETSFVVLRGTIRPDDVQADNSILSSRIADAEVQMIAEGSLTEAERKGWLNRMHSWINPF